MKTECQYTDKNHAWKTQITYCVAFCQQRNTWMDRCVGLCWMKHEDKTEVRWCGCSTRAWTDSDTNSEGFTVFHYLIEPVPMNCYRLGHLIDNSYLEIIPFVCLCFTSFVNFKKTIIQAKAVKRFFLKKKKAKKKNYCWEKDTNLYEWSRNLIIDRQDPSPESIRRSGSVSDDKFILACSLLVCNTKIGAEMVSVVQCNCSLGEPPCHIRSDQFPQTPQHEPQCDGAVVHLDNSLVEPLSVSRSLKNPNVIWKHCDQNLGGKFI